VGREVDARPAVSAVVSAVPAVVSPVSTAVAAVNDVSAERVGNGSRGRGQAYVRHHVVDGLSHLSQNAPHVPSVAVHVAVAEVGVPLNLADQAGRVVVERVDFPQVARQVRPTRAAMRDPVDVDSLHVDLPGVGDQVAVLGRVPVMEPDLGRQPLGLGLEAQRQAVHVVAGGRLNGSAGCGETQRDEHGGESGSGDRHDFVSVVEGAGGAGTG